MSGELLNVTDGTPDNGHFAGRPCDECPPPGLEVRKQTGVEHVPVKVCSTAPDHVRSGSRIDIDCLGQNSIGAVFLLFLSPAR